MLRDSTTQKRGKKTSSGGMRLFGNRLRHSCPVVLAYGVFLLVRPSSIRCLFISAGTPFMSGACLQQLRSHAGTHHTLRWLTDRLIPDDVVFLFIFKAWNPRIASYVKGFHNAEEGQKDPQGGMRLFGYRLMPQAIKQNARMISDSINQSDKTMVQWAHALWRISPDCTLRRASFR